MTVVTGAIAESRAGIRSYSEANIQELEATIKERQMNTRRLEAQRNVLNGQVRLLREELHMLLMPASNCGEVIKPMGKNKVLVKVGQEGKYVVDIDKDLCSCSRRLLFVVPICYSPNSWGLPQVPQGSSDAISFSAI